MGDKSYENFYSGGASSFSSEYGLKENGGGYLGKHVYSSGLGFPGSTQTANQLKEAVNAIKQGVKSFEVTMGNADTAEQIPKQNFEEMRALMKLTGVKPSVHAPFTIDAAGYEQQGGYSDSSRQESERRFWGVLQKAAQLSKEENVPVVFHSSVGTPGTEYRVGDEKKGEAHWHAVKKGIYNQESRALNALDEVRQFAPGISKEEWKEGGSLMTAEDRISMQNKSAWDQKITQLAFYGKEMDETLKNLVGISMPPEGVGENFFNQAESQVSRAKQFLHNNQLNMTGAWDELAKYGSEEQRKELWKLSEEYNKQKKEVGKELSKFFEGKDMKNFTMQDKFAFETNQIQAQSALLERTISRMQSISQGFNPNEKSPEYLGNLSEEEQMKEHEKWGAPKVVVDAEEFARDKSAETFGNLAWRGYKELGGEKAPVLAIENMYMGMAHPRAEDLKDLINKSRENFIKKAQKDGMSEKEAERVANKLIGATWDVGHLNIIKKYGFTDKDVIEQTKIIAKDVKHVHLTDNFGHADSHLAPGMGNVPIRAILEQLEKTGQLDKMRKIVEAPGFVQHFQKSPHGWTMAALGSPIYGAMMGPYWNQASAMASGGGYFGLPSAYMPEKHFSMYGSGFSSLPSELGGQIPGTASRFSGTPNT